MTTVIDAINLSVTIDNKKIISGITFSAQKGNFISIIGPNGAGKSTLLKCLARFLKPDGELFFLGKPSSRFSHKKFAREIAYIPQKYNIMYPFTVEEFVAMGRYPYRSPFEVISKTDREIVDEVIELTRLGDLRNRLLTTLSGGEMQKAVIAGAIAQQPKVLLLDEVMTYLDPHYQEEIITLIRNLNKEKEITILSVTHDLSFAMLFPQKILALSGGQKIFFGDAARMDRQILSSIYKIEFSFIKYEQTGKTIIIPDWKIHDSVE